MAHQNNLLELKKVSKQYTEPDGRPANVVLNHIDLRVRAGESIAVLGPSGSGKSTLLNIIGALDHPTTGEVFFDGQELSVLGDDEMAGIRNQKIGFIFQFHHLLPQCTVLENVLIPTLVHPDDAFKKNASSHANRLLEQVGLTPRSTYRPGQLSGGECQRVAVVRALINKPKLVLADEPTGSLDQKTAESMASLLVDLNREHHVALIVVTHSMSLANHMDTIYQLQDGRLLPHQAV